jgi:5-methylthioribose kinase
MLHGDIHSGSIFVAEDSFKAIDAEFGYFGPIGFDIGTAIGNLLNYCGLPGHLAFAMPPRLANSVCDIQTLWNTLPNASTLWQRRKRAMRRWLARLCLRVPEKVWERRVGFCGTELIRRSVGLSHVADIETIQDEAMRHECLRHAITLGKALIVIADRIDSVEELVARVRQYS